MKQQIKGGNTSTLALGEASTGSLKPSDILKYLFILFLNIQNHTFLRDIRGLSVLPLGNSNSGLRGAASTGLFVSLFLLGPSRTSVSWTLTLSFPSACLMPLYCIKTFQTNPLLLPPTNNFEVPHARPDLGAGILSKSGNKQTTTKLF